MPKNYSEFLQMMDERQWLRMLVCFLPALVLGKLAGSHGPGSFISLLATVALLVGGLTFVLWNRVRAKLRAGHDDEVDEDLQPSDEMAMPQLAAQDVTGLEQLAILAELREACGEAEPESSRLIETELRVNPGLSFAEATQAALARRKVLGGG